MRSGRTRDQKGYPFLENLFFSKDRLSAQLDHTIALQQTVIGTTLPD
jgi:hypothetical protein